MEKGLLEFYTENNISTNKKRQLKKVAFSFKFLFNNYSTGVSSVPPSGVSVAVASPAA